MKITAALLVVLALARTFGVNAVPLSDTHRATRGLERDINDFLALVPKEKIVDLFYQYLEEDKDFGEALDYVMSDEFKSLIVEIESLSEVKDLLTFLESYGFHNHEILNKIHKLLGIPPIHQIRILRSNRITGGLPGFIEDVKALLPIEKIEKLYNEKLETSKYFKALINRLKSKEFQDLIDKVMANPKLQDLMKRAEAKGVNVQAILDFLSTLLGLNFPTRPARFFLITRNLKDDLNDFLALLPQEKIVDLFYQYLEEDEDFGEALDYVMSDEFKSLIVEIESLSEVKELLNFLQESGLDAYGFLNNIHKLLGIPPIHQIRILTSSRITGGLPGFIEDIKALLPIEKIEKLYNEKLETSEDFKTLVTRLKSKEFQGLIDKIMANPKLQDLMKRAEAKGVNVQAILDFLSTLLGLHFPTRPARFFLVTRNLKDDLNDFLALLPQEKIVDLFYQYLEEDEDFGEALDYVMSDEFKSLIVEIESLSEVKDLLTFLQASGLDAYGFLNNIHKLLGIPPIHQIRILKSSRITGGLPGFIVDIKALLPIEKIEKLYNEKLESSEDFKTLVNRLKSKEFQGLIDKIMANPKLQELMKRAEAKGVNVQAILDFLSTLLGLNFPTRPARFFLITRNLKDDLNDFLALLPQEKIVDLFYQYLEEDEDFGEALDYVMSDEFKSLIVEIESLSEVKELLNFLQASGLDAYGFLNNIHKLLGIPPIHKIRILKSSRITGGLPGFIVDIKALLPIEKIEKLYNEKLETSEDFKTLVTRLKSKEFQGLIDKIMANPKLQDLIKRAEAKGVDVQAILDFLSSLLGLKFPSNQILIRAAEEEVIDILRHVWSKIDVDGIINIALDYLCDEQFKKVVKFMITDEFKKILLDIEEIKEVKELLKFLYDTGVDVYSGINDLHELLGIEKRLPLLRSECNVTGGVKGLFYDIWAILPREELRAYYTEKRQTNKKFNDFVTRLEKQELQNAINSLNKNDGFNLLLIKLENLGVNFDKVIDIILAVIGVKFPERPPQLL